MSLFVSALIKGPPESPYQENNVKKYLKIVKKLNYET
jgi:hypothetical protein